MNEIILSTNGLTKTYKGRNVVDNVTLSVKKGEVYGFVGLNGAGKTTFMRMLCGLIKPSGGSFTLFGQNTPTRRVAAIIEGAVFYPFMTGRDNLKAYLNILGKTTTDADRFLTEVGLDPALNTKAKQYSLGMRQRLSLAMALAGDAELLLLDEPTNGLDPAGMFGIRELLKKLAASGVTIFVSSHILSELEKLATTFGFIHQGKLLAEASGEQISKSVLRCHFLDTSDNAKAAKIFGDSAVIKGGKVELNGEFSATDIIKRLGEQGIETIQINSKSTDLEDYFRNLIDNASGAIQS